MKILYILMRNDLPSMNAGKAMAQASHASNAFVHSNEKSGPEFGVEEWKKGTSQGFGTVLVLGATIDQIDAVIDTVSDDTNIIYDRVIDPTYPYIVDKEIVGLIDSFFETSPAKELESGDFVCFRKEVTCAYIFGEEDEVNPFVKHLKLHP